MFESSRQPRLIIVSGLSGAGKSTALHFLSDFGFSVVDNLPVPLLHHFLRFASTQPDRYSQLALLPEIATSNQLEELFSVLKASSSDFLNLEILFLDCSNEVIVRRYSETRRPHPAFDPFRDHSLVDAINRERNLLALFSERATLRIDTSALTIHGLKRELKRFSETLLPVPGMLRLNLISFGFKYGIPTDCDLIVDVRFLPNPYFVQELRRLSGLDEAVQKYVLEQEHTAEFLTRYQELLAFLIPHYIFEGKSYLSVGIGCTGGRHRSVVITEQLAALTASLELLVGVKHRDIDNSAK